MRRTILVAISLVLIAAYARSQTGEAGIKAAMIAAPRPEFPEEAKARHIAGCGIYQLEINPKTGAPLKVQIIQSAGHPALNRAAVNCLVTWQARPDAVRVVKLPVCFEFKSGKPIVTYGS